MNKNKISGVYKVTNIVTGDFYIGSSVDVKRRWTAHRSPSQRARRPGMKLYQAYAKYGLDNFTFEIIEETDNLKEREQYWIDKLKPSYNSFWAKGWNTDRYKETSKRCRKEWYKVHKDEKLAKNKVDNSRSCLYEGDTLTLKALTSRFCRQGIPHAWTEAKKYLIQE